MGLRTPCGELTSPRPLWSPRAPAGVFREKIDAIQAPLVVVGHSYGGAPVTQAATGASNVSHLVYVAAFALDEGGAR
ncbi:alpha/beta fold hydrolase [Streptomyces sp. NPDC058914]|uniref:alpha/beta fold hydrolase n=1 Tax=Streptomyces sp. NPDC058914 TaxID=3346671 RepID=UPI003682DCCD